MNTHNTVPKPEIQFSSSIPQLQGLKPSTAQVNSEREREMAHLYSSDGHMLSASKALTLHLLCVLALAAALWVAQNIFASNLISNPNHTLSLLWIFECPVVIFSYSLLRQNPQQCSYLKAVGRALLGLPAGAVLNAFGAIVLGAPIRIEYLTKTINWSLLMSLFTCVPAAAVFGSSWNDWQYLFAHSRPMGRVDYMVSLPAHGAVIGAWFGAWPMPLDWERPWQEWPICVTYGAIGGYMLGVLASLVLPLVISRQQHVKGD